MSTSQTYTLDGPRDFTFPFPVRTADQITVSITPGGVLPSSEYQVIGASATANSITIRYPNAPTDGTKSLIIERRTEPQRVSTFLNDLSITATALNAEFDNALQLIQDGILGEFRGEWGSGEAYSELDVVRFAPEGNIYLADESHTSDDFATDLAEGKWVLLADFETGQSNIDAALQAAEAARDKAEDSETAAANSAAAAEISEDNAAASELNAATSAQNASNSASAAATSEQNAANSATAASNSATAASNSASAAATSEQNAEDSADAALQSEQNAAPVNAIVSEIETVAGIETEVVAVAGIDSSVDVVASDLAGAGFDHDLGKITQPTQGVVGTPDGFIISVFNIRDEIIAVENNETNINTVAFIESDVSAVAAIDTDVSVAANNIQAILDAPQAATDAETARDKAEQWAQEDEDVEVEPGEFSAFHWAQKAQERAEGAAINISYDNTTSGLTADDVQAGIDELVQIKAKLDGGNNFTGNQTIDGDVTITGILDCGSIA